MAVRQSKRNCRQAERQWRKTKLKVHNEIYKDKLNEYNKAIKRARQSVSKIINENINNSKVLHC